MTRAKLLVTICQIEWSRSLEYAFTTSNKKPKGKERLEEIKFLKGFMRLQDTALIGNITRAKSKQGAALRYQKRAVNQLVKAVHHMAKGQDF